jgi:hypothetical protein
MVQGFGVRGGRGRCFPFFESFLECVNTAGNERGYKCVKQADDYKECLHHQKAVSTCSCAPKLCHRNGRHCLVKLVELVSVLERPITIFGLFRIDG